MRNNFLFYFETLKNSPYSSSSSSSDLFFILNSSERKNLYFGTFVPDGNPKRFWNLSNKSISKLKKQGKIIVLDSMHEGFSTLYDKPNIKEIYKTCKEYSLSSKQIVYVTMNLKEQDNIDWFSNENNLEKINLLSLPFGHLEVYRDIKKYDLTLEKTKLESYNNHSDKICLNLNYRHRQPRAAIAFYLCTSPISHHCLISHQDKYKTNNRSIQFPNRTKLQEIDFGNITPLDIDKGEKTNLDLYKSTIFEVVGETLADDWLGTSREVSEKTFKPIVNFQPFVIYGQKGCNHFLKELGYKTYEDWFDLSFDFIDDPEERVIALCKSVEKKIMKLSQMTRKQRIEWRFKNETVLQHNYECFFKNVDNIQEKTRAFFSEIASQNC